MLKHFWRGIFRSLFRRKVHALINIASLTLGLAVFAFAFLYVKKELSYDRGWPQAESIYRLLMEQRGVPGRQDGESSTVATQLYPALLENFPDEIDEAVSVFTASVRPAGDETTQYRFLAVADPGFTDVFQLDLVAGSMERVLSGPGFIAVEEAYAASFAEPLALGSRITLEANFTNNNQRGAAPYEVAAIYRLSENVSGPVSFQLVTLMHDYAKQLYPPGMTVLGRSTAVWLTLKPGVDIGEMEARMPALLDSGASDHGMALGPGVKISDHVRLRLQALTDLHFNVVGFDASAGDATRTLTIAALGVLVLLAGCSNSISLSLAGVLERRREIGIRKAAGAQNADILRHYLAETVLLAVLALVPALLLVQALLPPFGALLNLRSPPVPDAYDYLVLLLIAVGVGLLNGAYPALVLSAVKPEEVLKVGKSAGNRGAQGLRTLIVGFQYCFALTLVIATLALYLQLSVVRAQPLGFETENRMLMFMNTDRERASAAGLFDAVRQLPSVLSAVQVAGPPNINTTPQTGSVNLLSRGDAVTEARAATWSAGADQFAALGIPLLAGRNFDAARDAYDVQARRYGDQVEGQAAEARIILNRAAVRALALGSPEAAVGRQIWQQVSLGNGGVQELPMRVVGVVEDSKYLSIRSKPGPEIYRPYFGNIGGMLVQYRADAKAGIQQEILQAWERVAGVQPQFLIFLEPHVASAYRVEQNESRLLLYSAGLALFLSAIGLYGLAAFTMERRVKEVGIRKVLGAEQGRITTLFLWRYARPVLLASVVAIPVAVYFVLQWMQRFPYQMEKIWLLPLSLGGAALVLVIALLTVTGVVLKAARSRPVQALRYE